MRKAAVLLIIALFSSLGGVAAAQTIPNVPDTARDVTYTVTSSTTNFDIPFALYGDCSDLSVKVAGVVQTSGFTCISKSGTPFANVAQPVTDGQVRFTTPITSGTVEITGARHPRFSMGSSPGITRTELNRTLGTIISKQRELFGPIGGDVVGNMPLLTLRSGAAAANVGALGGELTGTLPNPTIAAGVALRPGNNLSDVASPPIARANIGANGATWLELTDYVHLGSNANAGLQSALNDCGISGKPIHAAAGIYIFTASSNWPTANNNCPGIFGDGPDTIFAPVDFNGPIIQATVLSGSPQTNKVIRDISIQGIWSSGSPAYANSRLLNISGAADGWAFSRFERLRGAAVHDIVRFATPAVSGGGGLMQSNSGWNHFDAIFGQIGSQSIAPDSLINYADSTSTGNVYSNFIGAPATAFVYAGGGASMMVGDMVFNGGQLGGGRVLYIGGGSTCPLYGRSININNIQVDAGSIEAVKAECGFINNIKISGTLGGSAAWSGIDAVSLSEVHDLGESHWGAGGPVIIAGTGAHTLALWTVTLQNGSYGGTFTQVELAITGTLGGVGSGGSKAIYDCASRAAGAASCKLVSGDGINADIGTSAPAAGWPVFSFSITGNVVTFSVDFTDTLPSTFRSNIIGKYGAFKIQRGPSVTF